MTDKERILRESIKVRILSQLDRWHKLYNGQTAVAVISAIFLARIDIWIINNFYSTTNNIEKIVYGITALVYSGGVGTMLRNSISSHKNTRETKKEWRIVASQNIEDMEFGDTLKSDIEMESAPTPCLTK